MFTVEDAGVGYFIANIVVILIAAVIICYRESRREDGAGANERPGARVVTVAAPAPVLPRPATAMAPVEPRPITATAPVVVKLGYFPYSADGRRASENLVCAICLEVFQHEDTCSEVPACRHLFHRDCIGAWMKTKTTCPLCRHRIVTGSERVAAADDMV